MECVGGTCFPLAVLAGCSARRAPPVARYRAVKVAAFDPMSTGWIIRVLEVLGSCACLVGVETRDLAQPLLQHLESVGFVTDNDGLPVGVCGSPRAGVPLAPLRIPQEKCAGVEKCLQGVRSVSKFGIPSKTPS